MTQIKEFFGVLFYLCIFIAEIFSVQSFASELKIINFENQFNLFWTQASGKPFEEQVKIWDAKIEKDQQEFYDSVVWEKKSNPKWPEKKINSLRRMFAKYPSFASNILQGFRTFPKVLGEQIDKYHKIFPNAKFDLPIYAVPSLTFNGKSGNLESSPEKNILAFGIDVMTVLGDNPDILYSHELFHIYQSELIGMNEKVFMEEGKLTLPLWLEGLATYVSEVFNPRSTDGALLFDRELAKVSPKDRLWLIDAFLKEANEKAFDQKKPEIYLKWFGVSDHKLRSDLPNRCGYLLGLNLARHLGKKYPLKEMAQWKVPEIHGHVIEGLKTLSSR